MKRPRSATVDLKVRMKEPLRASLEKAAKADGISLNAEAVRMIEEGFRTKEEETSLVARTALGIYVSFGGLEAFTVMRLLANAASVIEMRTKTKWLDDPATFDQVRRALISILKVLRPTDDRKVTNDLLGYGFQESEKEHLGEKVATSVIEEWLEAIRFAEALRDHAKANKETPKARG